MKKTTLTLFGIAGISAGLLIAQGHGFGRWGGNQSADPQERVARRIAHLSVVLDLADDQKAAASKIFAAACEGSQALHSQSAELREKWQDAIKSNNVGLIESLSRQWADQMADRRAAQAKAQAEFYQILTVDQRAKFDEIHGAGFGKHGGRGHHGRGGRGMGSMHGAATPPVQP